MHKVFATAVFAIILTVPCSAIGQDVIVDDPGDLVCTWSSSPGGYNDTYYYFRAAGTGSCTATWKPALPEAGVYNVFAWWNNSPNRATDAPYTIYSNGEVETIDVNQEINGSQWYLLGTYSFDAGTSGSVVLSDDANDFVVADAVKFELFSNTQVGDTVVVKPQDCSTGTVGSTPVTVTFDTVTEAGVTTVCTSSTGSPPPSGFMLIEPPTYYEINTTATYSGNIEICIHYGQTHPSEEQFQLFHLPEGAQNWEHVTISSHDTEQHIICGIVTSLSPFAIFGPATSGGGSTAVGGTAHMANKAELLVPWIALALLIGTAIGGVVLRKKVRG